MQDLGIVIVNYNVVSLLRRCLQSVFGSIGVTMSVCVVDNCSSDGSAEMVRAEFPQVRLICNGQNCGYSAANNIGLRHLLSVMPVQTSPNGRIDPETIPLEPVPPAEENFRHLLLLNPDTELPPDALKEMVAFMDAHPNAGVAGPMLVRPNGELDLACRRSFPTPLVSLYRILGLTSLFPKSPRFARYNLTYLDPKQQTEVDAVVGAFMMVRTLAVKQAGMLDEDFFMYGEDLDWAYRIKELGWQVWYYPKVVVLHFKGESSKQLRAKATSEFYRAMIIFYRKHYAAKNVFLLNWLITGAIYLRGGLAALGSILRPTGKRRMV